MDWAAVSAIAAGCIVAGGVLRHILDFAFAAHAIASLEVVLVFEQGLRSREDQRVRDRKAHAVPRKQEAAALTVPPGHVVLTARDLLEAPNDHSFTLSLSGRCRAQRPRRSEFCSKAQSQSVNAGYNLASANSEGRVRERRCMRQIIEVNGTPPQLIILHRYVITIYT